MVYHFAFHIIFNFEKNDAHSKNFSSEQYQKYKERGEKEKSNNHFQNNRAQPVYCKKYLIKKFSSGDFDKIGIFSI